MSSTAVAPAPSFAEIFGREPELTADAPGRVNLIGEHTDYSGGFVLPLAIPQRTRVELARRQDDLVRAWSAEMSAGRSAEGGQGDSKGADSTQGGDPNAGSVRNERPGGTAGSGHEPAGYRLGEETPGRGWLDYVQGVTQVLALAGHRLSGFDLRITSEVPVGAGLSSSAALEISLLRGLRELFGLDLGDVELARLGRRAENEFVGAPVGIMDQMAAVFADVETALFLDTRSLRHEQVPLPPDAELAVIDSGVSHSHAKGEYRTRRREIEEAARLLGVAELRDLGENHLDRIAALPPPLDRRARHVVTENARVLAAVEALRAGDTARLGELINASHQSLQHDFEVSVPEVDLLVELAQAQPGVQGARMTGGGFGGSIVVLAQRGKAKAAAERAAAAYRQQTGQMARVLVPAG